MTSLRETAAGLAGLEEVVSGVERVRAAATALRWHPALRRRTPEAAAESRVRGAWASAALDGAVVPVERVRESFAGGGGGTDPVDRVLEGVVAATAETERLAAVLATSPLQVLARLHVVAARSYLAAERVGRPRVADETSAELADLGPAPSADEAGRRLREVADLVRDPRGLPLLVVAALAHAELAVARPFGAANGVIGRALERTVLVAGGLDPTGVAVPEVGHRAGGDGAYVGALLAYREAPSTGGELWLRHSTAAVLAGIDEGVRVADAVLAGRLD